MTAKLDSTVHLLNKSLESLTEELQSYFSNTIHFVALSEKDWKFEKQEYVKNIKNGQKYSLISEETLDDLKPKVYSEIEDIATNVFNRDKIELV